jgi:hypothetical protein
MVGDRLRYMNNVMVILSVLLVFWMFIFAAVHYQTDDVLAVVALFSVVTAWVLWRLKPAPRQYRTSHDRLKAIATPATEWGRFVQLLSWFGLITGLFWLFRE